MAVGKRMAAGFELAVGIGKRMPAALCILRRSPIQILTQLNVA